MRFVRAVVTPGAPTDGKYSGQLIPGIRILVTNRSSLQPSRVGAALLWAIAKTSRTGLVDQRPRVRSAVRLAAIREALLRGDDPTA